MLKNSIYFGIMISILAYVIGLVIQKTFKLPIFNPLLISIIIIIAFLLCFNIDYDSYYESAKHLSFLLTPATVCLAIPLYEEFELLQKNMKAIMAGLLSGVMTSLVSILLLSGFFHLSHSQYVTLLPKSITTAIGIGVSEELGGIVTITVTAIIVTGIFGSIISEKVCRLVGIQEPIAKGVAIGSAAHVIGTVKAMEMGEVEGAMSSLSIGVAGLLTVVGASVFTNFL